MGLNISLYKKIGLSKRQAINALNRGEKVCHRDMGDTMYVIRPFGSQQYEYEDGEGVDIDEFWEYWGQARFEHGWMILK